MHMSMMEKRLQILLDEERYRRITAEADASGRSVAAVVRQAIDVCYPPTTPERLAAGRRLVAAAEANAEGAEPDWEDVKRDLAADLEARLP